MSTVKVNTVDKRTGSTLTLGGCGTTVTLAAGATQSGFGRTGTVDWCTTAKTAPFTGVSGKGYFVNTTCGAVTVTLPATPSAGDIISIADYASTFQTNNTTICGNGSKINGVCATAKLQTQGQSVTLVYVDATKGWKNTMDSTSNVTGASFITATGGTVVTCGDYKTHIFTSSGCFSVSSISSTPTNNSVDYLVVAGGGGGGARHGGGGGAGGFRVSNALNLPAPSMSPLVSGTGITVTASTYPITIGGGGTGGTFTNAPSNPGSTSGSNSVFSTITSTGGGGGGGAIDDHPVAGQGLAGGSGGGTDGNCRGGPGAGNTPPVSPVQGFAGGNNTCGAVVPYGGAGGGGASQAGESKPYASPYASGLGGNGSYISNSFINPTCAPSYGEAGPVSSTRYFAGGGGGGVYDNLSPLSPAAPGGFGGGGDGVQQNTPTPANANGVTNTGGGGGGEGGINPTPSPGQIGGNGGSGIVMIRYKYQ